MVGVLESDMSEVRLICSLNFSIEPAGTSVLGVDCSTREPHYKVKRLFKIIIILFACRLGKTFDG